MKLVVQRVIEASCIINNEIYSSIGKGFMVLVGLGINDNKEIVYKMANKLSKLRIFEDENDKINKSLDDVNGSILSISQFTLYADTKKGNRPSFINALAGDKAKELYDYFNECLRELNIDVKTGVFGGDMKINLINDGPVTIIMEEE